MIVDEELRFSTGRLHMRSLARRDFETWRGALQETLPPQIPSDSYNSTCLEPTRSCSTCFEETSKRSQYHAEIDRMALDGMGGRSEAAPRPVWR